MTAVPAVDPRLVAALASGAPVDEVCTEHGVPRKAVMDAGFGHGLRYIDGQDRFAMTDKARTILRQVPTPAAPPDRPPAAAGPITVGLACPDPKVRRAAEKARDAVETLRDLLAAWEEKAAARAKVERLERELAAAKARLRPAPRRPTPAAEAWDNAAVRVWAKSAGIDCPTRGRVPQHVRDAYAAAHPRATS